MTSSAAPLPRLTSVILEGVSATRGFSSQPAPLWQVAYRQYDCTDLQRQLVRAPDAESARRILEENLGGVGCQVHEVVPFASLPAGTLSPAPQPRVRSRLCYEATQFNYLGDHPGVRMEVTPRSTTVGFSVKSPASVADGAKRFGLKPGWWVLEKDGQVMATVPPAQFTQGFEPAETQADAGVRAAVEALCREIENEPFALQEPASSEKRGRLYVMEKLKAILASN